MKKFKFTYTIDGVKYSVNIDADNLNRALFFFGNHYSADEINSVKDNSYEANIITNK